MFKFLFKSKFLGFVEAPVGVFQFIHSIFKYFYTLLHPQTKVTLRVEVEPRDMFPDSVSSIYSILQLTQKPVFVDVILLQSFATIYKILITLICQAKASQSVEVENVSMQLLPIYLFHIRDGLNPFEWILKNFDTTLTI